MTSKPMVKLYSYTQLAQGDDRTLTDMIAFCARVSNPGNQNNTATNDKLIKYLATHKHFSPFEMVSATLEIETTRDIARQILRHRSFSFQEFSQRYGLANSFSKPREARMQDTKNRQNSLETNDANLHTEWTERQSRLLEMARVEYEWAIAQGIAKEVARAVLPEGLTTSRLYMAGTIRSWMHYMLQRTDPSTQKEHRTVALACAEALKPIFPEIMQFVVSEDPVAF